MIFQQSLLVALFSLCASSADAFMVGNPSVSSLLSSGTRTSNSCFQPTCLREKEEESGAEEETITAGDDAPSDSATDILNSPAFLSRKVEVLKSDIEKADEELAEAKEVLEAGKAEWGSQLDDLQKEYKNIQERMSSQNKQGDVMAIREVVREMLEVMDNFDRAFMAVTPETDEEKAIEAAYKEVYQSILDTFAELGVKPVETVGTEFDYELHQAVMQVPSEKYEEGIVSEEFQKGFILGETLIRAAMVAVAA
mmetsp:Transcript_135261/g.201151  ORF Transcript_135261/g.201151 Transcript_135261/m.201151 type:complete len:253 (-) Transcript_135261:77-835(-)|eukprot:CAMPEP_0117031126 /NCGR_PEP_ID=MMETSP0472-20121206/22410_1 /TAXON_ID=693140 ORGANISM="Tiarina fusus, Strain LIS" /NCGR_SAMPLE_ID=MMETSP0472 /ASSEMBLY_ACC=CAM_ASM_000603 /LENGTH=252 /DNA_ID=CAMNT_0004739391 /DNA_START=148 /DNA_END=906 /DNA_ORIENTATION=-